jgi:hypothetical protein
VFSIVSEVLILAGFRGSDGRYRPAPQAGAFLRRVWVAAMALSSINRRLTFPEQQRSVRHGVRLVSAEK